MKITRKTSSTLCVDIHGMREREAKFRLVSNRKRLGGYNAP